MQSVLINGYLYPVIYMAMNPQFKIPEVQYHVFSLVTTLAYIT